MITVTTVFCDSAQTQDTSEALAAAAFSNSSNDELRASCEQVLL
jgi:hypothetical protein